MASTGYYLTEGINENSANRGLRADLTESEKRRKENLA
jgi:hypothetical protein